MNLDLNEKSALKYLLKSSSKHYKNIAIVPIFWYNLLGSNDTKICLASFEMDEDVGSILFLFFTYIINIKNNNFNKKI